MGPGPRGSTGPGPRAQTTIDYAIAMGIFLVALTTIVAFMPTMTQPFAGGQHNPLLADRLAAQLVDGQLGDPAAPSVLSTTCTMYFFNESPGDPCGTFDATDDVNRKVGVPDETFINVTLTANTTGNAAPDVLCGDGAGSLVDCPGSEALALGPSPPTESGSVTSARRVGLFGDRTVYVEVKVWS